LHLHCELWTNSSPPAYNLEAAKTCAAAPAARQLPPRSMVGQLTLDQHIGVRIPGGQPNLYSLSANQSWICLSRFSGEHQMSPAVLASMHLITNPPQDLG